MTSNEGDRQKLTKAHIQAALIADIGNNASLVSWTFDDSVQVKGDAGTSYITSINVNYTLEDANNEVDYVVKINPSHKGAMAEMSQSIFKHESLFYSKLVPLLNQQLIVYGHPPLRFPKLFFSINSDDCQIIIMENLKTQGFVRRNKRLGMDAAHTKLVVQELGRLNAASKLAENSLGSIIEENFPNMKMKVWSGRLKFLAPWLSSLIEDSINLAKKEGSKYKGVLGWLEKAQKNAGELLDRELVDDAPQFSVLGHNDCWTANFMFRYNQDGKPEEVRIFDFQAPRKISAAIDLNNLFYNSMSGTNRKTHREELLDFYYNSFSTVMRTAKQEPQFTLKQLDDECRRKMVHGILYGLMFIQLAIGAPVEQGNWNVFEEGGNKEQNQSDIKDNNKDQIRQSYLDIFEEMIQFGIVD